MLSPITLYANAADQQLNEKIRPVHNRTVSSCSRPYRQIINNAQGNSIMFTEIAAFTVTAFHDITLAALNFVEQVQYTALV